MKRLILLFSLVGILASCERDATVDPPIVDPKLGLACFISPDDSIVATLTEVSPIYGGGLDFFPEDIKDAEMYLSNGQDTVQLVFSVNGYKDLAGKMTIEAGRTYWLWARAPGYPPISASCTVPSYKVPVYDVEFSGYDNGYDSSYQVKLTWQDKVGERNYYRVMASLTDSAIGNLIISRDLIFNENEYRDDLDRDGQLLNNFPSENNFQSNLSPNSRYIESSILTVDQNYYEYHRDLINYQGDNPFAEPVQLYSNVEGGSGIFAAFQIRRQLERIF